MRALHSRLRIASHKDKRWRTKLEAKLSSGIYEKFEFWSDERLEASQVWRDKINAAIASSRVALLLVSRNFLRSKFIVNDELRKILKRRKAGGVKVFWIAIDSIPNNLLGEAGLDLIQALWPRDKPLSKLKPAALEDAWTIMGSRLIDAIDHEQWDDLKQKVDEALADVNVVLEKVIAEGDYSVFYKAKQGDIDVAIKALVPGPGREWLKKDFVARANLVSKIANSTAINIRAVIDGGLVPCVVMEFVHAETLARQLEEGKRLHPRTIADILAQLVRIAGHLHKMDGQPILGPVRPSHVHYDGKLNKAFISLVPIANETLTSCRTEPTKLLTWGMLPYLSPERYYGEPLDGQTDQYHLGLLALELLEGRFPFAIRSFGDFQTSAGFFTSPRKYFSEEFRRREPALAFILAKMLERNPRERWETTQALVDALQDVAAGKVPEVIKQHVDAQYAGALKDNLEFFSSFYGILFDKSDEIKQIFERYKVGMNEQPGMLAEAIASIVDFKRASFGQHVSRHLSVEGIKPKHFELFGEAFLDALRNAQISDDYSQDAWRAVLNAALTYMSERICSASAAAGFASNPTASAR